MEHSKSSIVFLDLKILIAGPMLMTGMYSKPSDTHAYLMPTSCHPTHVCRNIPKGVMKRVKRNCSEESACNQGYTEYKQHLVDRGYNNFLIDKTIADAEATPREQLIGLVKAGTKALIIKTSL